MKYSLILLQVVVLFCCCSGQENGQSLSATQFEKAVLEYQPRQAPGVSDKAFSYGTMILAETKEATKDNPSNFNLADYFNVLSAFLTLQESDANLKLAFRKFIAAEGACEYLAAFKKKVQENDKYQRIRADWLAKERDCQQLTGAEEPFNAGQYATRHSLDEKLVRLMHRIKLADQRYRQQDVADMDRQRKIDIRNQRLIDSLYRAYQTYIGRSLVGDELESVMWAVIQHSNVEMMEKYLPVLQDAVQRGELAEGSLKLLIDRYYGLKHGYQIFGSQGGFGFKLADKATRQAVMKQYGIQEKQN